MDTRKRIIFAIVLALLVGLPATTVNAGGLYQSGRSASVTLAAPTPNPVATGSDVTVDLVLAVTNIDPGVAGVEIYLRYDPAFVAPSTSPGVGVVEVRPDFFGTSNVSINEILPAAQCPGGTLPCVHLVLAGSAQTTRTGTTARFHFRGTAEGSACFLVAQSVLVDANGFQVDNVVGPSQCVAVAFRASANGVISRQGVPANPNPGGGSPACSSASAIGTTTFGPVTVDTSGRFNIGNLPPGTYTLRVAYPGYLTSEKTGIALSLSSPTADLGTTNLRGGDVNGDNAINILDIGVIISKFGRTGAAVKSASANCSGADDAADINDDSLINISDLAVAVGNWGRTGPTAWQP